MDITIIGNISMDSIFFNDNLVAKTIGGAAFNMGVGYVSNNDIPNILSIVGSDIDEENYKLLNKIFSGSDINSLNGKTCAFELKYSSNIDVPPIDISNFGISENITNIALSKKYNTERIHLCCNAPIDYPRVLQYLVLNEQKRISLSFSRKSIEKIHLIKNELQYIDFIFLNIYEFNILKTTLSLVDLEITIIITNGSLGSFAIKKNKLLFEQRANKASKVVDVTGAGDIFAGTFLSSIKNSNIPNAMKEASYWACESLSGFGVVHLINNKLK